MTPVVKFGVKICKLYNKIGFVPCIFQGFESDSKSCWTGVSTYKEQENYKCSCHFNLKFKIFLQIFNTTKNFFIVHARTPALAMG